MPFLRLIRWKNLSIVALTMIGIFLFFGGFQNARFSQNIAFFLFILAVLLLTGAGNVINDYCDVETDRINKGDKMIVTKYISFQSTLRLYRWMNIGSLGLFCVVGFLLHSFLHLFIGSILISLLLFYSKTLKKRFLSGNLLVSMLVAFIPIWSMLFLTQIISINELLNSNSSHFLVEKLLVHFHVEIGIWSVPAFLSILSFIINFLREIVKDLEDVEGDKAIGSTTFAIVVEEKKVLKTISVGVWILLIYLIYGCISALVHSFLLSFLLLPIVLVGVILVRIGLLIETHSNPGYLKKIDRLLKLILLMGCILPFYWAIL